MGMQFSWPLFAQGIVALSWAGRLRFDAAIHTRCDSGVSMRCITAREWTSHSREFIACQTTLIFASRCSTHASYCCHECIAVCITRQFPITSFIVIAFMWKYCSPFLGNTVRYFAVLLTRRSLRIIFVSKLPFLLCNERQADLARRPAVEKGLF